MRTGSKQKNSKLKHSVKTNTHTEKATLINVSSTDDNASSITSTAKSNTASSKDGDVSNYFFKHWNILKKSFNFDSVLFKLMLIDIGFIVSLFLSYVLVYFLWIRNILTVSYLVNILNTPQISDVPASEIVSAWNHFVTAATLILLLVLLLYMIVLSIYSALSHMSMTKNKFSARLFLNFICTYTIFTLIYLLILLSIFYFSKNILLAAWCLILITILYLYTLFIFYLVTKDGKLSQIFSHGFSSMIRLHHTLPPIVLALIMFLAFLSIVLLIFGNWPFIVFMLLLLIMIYLSNWMKKYLHQIIHS